MYRSWHDVATGIVRKIIDTFPNTEPPDVGISESIMMWLFGNKVKNESGDYVTDEHSRYLVSDKDVNDYQYAFVEWLDSFEPNERLVIIINRCPINPRQWCIEIFRLAS